MKSFALHAPSTHSWPLGHAFMQLPQVAGSLRSASQPSIAALLQSSQPISQLFTRQLLPEHAGSPCATSQAFPHAPQEVRVVRRSTSQPSSCFLLQSPKPAPQVESAHARSTHAASALLKLQDFLQAPQLVKVSVGVSQPSFAWPLQSPKPALHAIAQLPAEQLGVPLSGPQTLKHAPQWLTLLSTSTHFLLQQRSLEPQEESLVQLPSLVGAQPAVKSSRVPRTNALIDELLPAGPSKRRSYAFR